MLRFGLSVGAMAAAIACQGASAAASPSEDGIVAEAPDSGGVTLKLPRCADKGTVAVITVYYPDTSGADVTITLDQPTSGPPYILERKTNRRIDSDVTSGMSDYFYIDTSSQIGGTAKVKAIVANVGKASGTFLIPC